MTFPAATNMPYKPYTITVIAVLHPIQAREIIM